MPAPQQVNTPPPDDVDSSLQQVAQQFPAYEPYLSNVVVAPRKTTATDDRQVEFYAPWEESNPHPGKLTIEPYRHEVMSGGNLPNTVAGELLHYIGGVNPATSKPVDPNYYALKQGVANARSEHQVALDHVIYNRLRKQGEDRPFNQWLNQSRLDEYIMGYVTPDKTDEWRQNGFYKRPEMANAVEAVKQYLTTPRKGIQIMDGLQAADQMQQSAQAVPPQQAPQQPQPTDVSPGGQIAPVASPQLPTVDPFAHDTAFGRAAKALLGSTTDYTVDPKTGQTIATQTPRKPGQLFKDILSAAILGGAAGANGDPRQGFAGGITRGGAAAVNDQRQQDLLKRQQAREQFQDQNAASANQRADNADQRAAQEAITMEQLRKAQVAQANSETIRTNVLTQGTTYDQHEKVANAGKQHFSDYEAAGLQPIMKDISETDMQQTISNRPGASTYDWEATGVKPILDAKGNPTYVYTYSAFDPKGQIPVSKGTIDQWKADGMDKMYPDLFSMVKAGKSIDAQQYVELKRTDAKLFNDSVVRTKASQDTAEGKARIALQNAEAGKNWAEAAEARSRKGQLDLAKNQTQALDTALTELSDPKQANGDFTKLSPKSKVVIGESAKVMLPSLEAEARAALQADPSDSQGVAKQAMQQMDQIRGLALQAITGPQAQAQVGDPRVTAAITSLQGKSPADIEKALSDPRIPEASKAAIRKGLGVSAPASAPSNLDRPMGTVIGGAVVNGLHKIGEKFNSSSSDTHQSLLNQAASQK